ncbi:glycosyltransferase family 4 protein [Hirschia baltica]|uniref:Glycosyl transferase group 1 n=1 Tax=Hirschia baltica (strain ATCC 49814 / DSM 5838 / IFAM 1418) TaxID=582402 RepID=C6XKG7_HIRBI|nr:glycosyltransferase family 4 protein [Hirschia baltica]ACT57765.1 glycosyl transferase group 1 [Hirschia baltica ATCC 49814]
MTTDKQTAGDASLSNKSLPDLSGKTILQVIPDLAAGGAERTTVEVAEAIVNAGGRALIASAGGRLETELKAVGGELVRRESLPSKNPIKIFQNAGWLQQIISKENVSLIHARSRAPAWSAYWASKATHIPFVTTYHGAYNAKSALKHWYNSVMARGNIVIANSAFIAEHVAITYPKAANRVVTIPRGVDLKAFTKSTISQTQRDAIIESWFSGTKPDLPIILLPGRLTGWKGQKIAIQAMTQLAQNGNKDWILILAGDDQGRTEYTSELRSMIDRESLSEHIKIVGHCSDIPAAMDISDIVLAPSQEAEAFGRVAAEAGALELPTIVSDLGGQRETVIEGVTGFRVKAGDINALSRAIQKALQMPIEQRQIMGKKAALHIQSNFTTANLQAMTLGVYADVLQSKTNTQRLGHSE